MIRTSTGQQKSARKVTNSVVVARGCQFRWVGVGPTEVTTCIPVLTSVGHRIDGLKNGHQVLFRSFISGALKDVFKNKTHRTRHEYT